MFVRSQTSLSCIHSHNNWRTQRKRKWKSIALITDTQSKLHGFLHWYFDMVFFQSLSISHTDQKETKREREREEEMKKTFRYGEINITTPTLITFYHYLLFVRLSCLSWICVASQRIFVLVMPGDAIHSHRVRKIEEQGQQKHRKKNIR